MHIHTWKPNGVSTTSAKQTFDKCTCDLYVVHLIGRDAQGAEHVPVPLLQVGSTLQAGELAATHMQAKVQHAERAARVHEAAAGKLRARLAAQVTAEERRCKRNAEAYTRAKRTIAANKGVVFNQDTCMSSAPA